MNETDTHFLLELQRFVGEVSLRPCSGLNLFSFLAKTECGKCDSCRARELAKRFRTILE